MLYRMRKRTRLTAALVPSVYRRDLIRYAWATLATEATSDPTKESDGELATTHQAARQH